MTSSEFNQWYDQYCAAFPGTMEFVERGGNPKITLGFWFKVLEPFSLDVANTATMRMLAGHDEAVPVVDRATTPKHVADVCQRIVDRHKLTTLPKSSEPQYSDQEPAQWDGREICRKLMACAANGGDVEALSRRLMPIDPENEPRYRCLWCRDRGRLTVWSPHTMRLSAKGKAVVGGRGLYSECITCHCRAGELYKKADKPLFNDRQWLVCRGIPYKQADLDELTAFVANIKPANYEYGFEAYNASAEV